MTAVVAAGCIGIVLFVWPIYQVKALTPGSLLNPHEWVIGAVCTMMAAHFWAFGNGDAFLFALLCGHVCAAISTRAGGAYALPVGVAAGIAASAATSSPAAQVGVALMAGVLVDRRFAIPRTHSAALAPLGLIALLLGLRVPPVGPWASLAPIFLTAVLMCAGWVGVRWAVDGEMHRTRTALLIGGAAGVVAWQGHQALHLPEQVFLDYLRGADLVAGTVVGMLAVGVLAEIATLRRIRAWWVIGAGLLIAAAQLQRAEVMLIPLLVLLTGLPGTGYAKRQLNDGPAGMRST